MAGHQRTGHSNSVLPPEFTPKGIGLAALIASGTRDGIAIVGPDGELVFWNSAASAITGWSLEQAAERNLGELVKASKSLIRSLGLMDAKTGLAGRDLALVQLDHAIALAKRDKRSVGLLSLKVDRFRQLRESAHGEVTDEVIRQFAARITAFVRGSDVPARLSNDSFLVVLAALNSTNDADIVAVRLLMALAEPFDISGEARSIDCSIGVAEFPRDAEDATALLEAALAAADRAQLMGGGQYRVATETRGP